MEWQYKQYHIVLIELISHMETNYTAGLDCVGISTSLQGSWTPLIILVQLTQVSLQIKTKKGMRTINMCLKQRQKWYENVANINPKAF